MWTDAQTSSVTDHVWPHDSSKCNNGGAERCMLHWTELNCTACKNCSFCADNRTAEGGSGFCIDYSCYFRSIKLKQLNMLTLEFLVFLHCSCSPDNTALEKQLTLHSWHVCEKKKSRVGQMFCKQPRPESLTRAPFSPPPIFILIHTWNRTDLYGNGFLAFSLFRRVFPNNRWAMCYR